MTTETAPSRLVSLDVFRGITIAFMILVNQAGVADHVYSQLDHAPWHGWTLTDMVFPFFLFAVGMALSFSLKKHTESGQKPPASLYFKILKRGVMLFGIGLLLNGFYKYDLASIRLMGVLQRIALAYLFTSLIVLNLSVKKQWAVCGGLLLAYWLALTCIPVPGIGAGVLTREGSFSSWIDRLLIAKAHLYKGDGWNGLGDPEGLFSTLPAIAGTLTGYFAGEWVRTRRPATRDILIAGALTLGMGALWSVFFPINKKLWTSSYVLFTSGMALLLFAACYELADVRNRRAWLHPFEVLGANSIFAFVASVFLIKILTKFSAGGGENAPSLFEWINSRLFESWLGPLNGPTVFAVVTLLFWWAVLYAMYRKRIFIKL